MRASPLESNRPEQRPQLPLRVTGRVIHGFGRGSRTLGIPTANLPINELATTAELDTLEPGIYLGWAQVRPEPSEVAADGDADVHPMAMSVGWNPFFQNTKKTLEIHVVHRFARDFYGKELRAIALEYIRPEKNFDSLAALVEAINADIALAVERVRCDAFARLRDDALFRLAAPSEKPPPPLTGDAVADQRPQI